jgi:hypothetical protein
MSNHPAEHPAHRFTLSQLISALDDRNILRAIRVLEPSERAETPSPSDQPDGRCVRCITRGE